MIVAVVAAIVIAACSNGKPDIGSATGLAPSSSTTSATPVASAANVNDSLARNPMGIHYSIAVPKGIVYCMDEPAWVEFTTSPDDQIHLTMNILARDGVARIVMTHAAVYGSKDLSDCQRLVGDGDLRGFARDANPGDDPSKQFKPGVVYIYNVSWSIHNTACWERVQLEMGADDGISKDVPGFEFRQPNTTCVPPTPPSCTLSNQTIRVGDTANFSAPTGDDPLTWTSPGTPTTGTGKSFSSKFDTVGDFTVKVKNDAGEATCAVKVLPKVIDPVAPSCAPANQTIKYGDIANFTATGDDPLTWTSPGTPTTGTGKSFSSRFDKAGDFTVKVKNAVGEASCAVKVNPPPPLSCTVASPTSLVGEAVRFGATGGNGVYAWSTAGGNPSVGQGAIFNTTYNSVGTFSATVTSGEQTASCQVRILPKVECNDPQMSLSSPSGNMFRGQMHNASAHTCKGGGFWFIPSFTDAVGNPVSVQWAYRITKWVVDTHGNPQTASGVGSSIDAPIGDVPPGGDIEIEVTILDQKPVFGWLRGICENCSVVPYDRNAFPPIGPVPVRTN
jgi:hypothetical protein